MNYTIQHTYKLHDCTLNKQTKAQDYTHKPALSKMHTLYQLQSLQARPKGHLFNVS